MDLYVYIYRARIHSVFDENSYLVPYSEFSEDKLYPSLENDFSGNTNIYGPLFTLISTGLAKLGGNSLFFNFIIFKFFFIVLNILCALIIFKTTKSIKATYLYAFNPYLIYEFALKAHLDVVHIFLVLGGLYFYFQKPKIFNFCLGWFLLFLSVLIKYVTAIYLPIYFFLVLRLLPNLKSRLKFISYSFFGSLALLIILYFPFYEGPEMFKQLFNFNQILNQYFMSLGIIIVMMVLAIFGIENFKALAILLSRLIFVGSYFFSTVYLIFKKNILKHDLTFYLCLISAIFLFTFFNRFMPWYNTILIALLIIHLGKTNNFKYDYLIYALSLYSLVFYIFLR